MEEERTITALKEKQREWKEREGRGKERRKERRKKGRRKAYMEGIMDGERD